MTTLAALVNQLMIDVPAVNDVPSSAQYEQAVINAVQDFSRRCGRIKYGELNIVSGTATYDLAADFQDLISLESLAGADGVIISDNGIIPISADWEERYSIVNGEITFVPTPTYTLTRDYAYKTRWILTGVGDSREYADLGDAEAQIILIRARQLALERITSAQTISGTQRYSLGAVSVDKSTGVDGMVKQMYALHAEFVDACERYNGAYRSAA